MELLVFVVIIVVFGKNISGKKKPETGINHSFRVLSYATI